MMTVVIAVTAVAEAAIPAVIPGAIGANLWLKHRLSA
jgi:hypothetical protein